MKLGMEVYNQFFIIPYKFIKLHKARFYQGFSAFVKNIFL